MNTIYKGLYVPIVTYASAAWYDLTTKAQKNKLIMSQRHALIKVTGVYRTTAAHSLTVLTGNMPITFECQKRAEHYKIRRNIGFSVGEFVFPGETDIEFTADETKALIKAAKHAVQQDKMIQWQNEWDESSKGRKTYKYLPNVLERCKSSWININGIRWTAQFITGHGFFKTFKKRFGFCNSSLCSCGEEDSPEHVLTSCEKYNSIREKFKRENNTQLASETELMEKSKYSNFVEFAKELLEVKEITEGQNLLQLLKQRWYQINKA